MVEREALPKKAMTAAYYVAFGLLGMTSATMGPTLPGLAESTGVTLARASFFITLRTAGYFIGSVTAGRFYDRFPAHALAALALGTMVLTMGLVPVTPLFWLLLALLLLLGTAEGFIDVGGNTLLTWLHRDQVAPFMNGLHFFFAAGSFVSPLIVAQTIRWTGGITWGYWALALLIPPVAVWLLRLPAPTPVVQEGAEEGGGSALLIVLIALFLFLYAGAELTLGGWLATYVIELGMGGEVIGSYLTSAFYGGLTLGRLLSIPLAARLRPRTLLVADLGGAFLGLLVILLQPGSVTATAVGVAVVGLSMASIFPTMISFAERHLVVTGRVTSWIFTGVSLGVIIVPSIVGQLFEGVGPRVVPLAAFVNLLLAALLLGLLLRERE
jgi:FHS family Na+ dependent glucose MFS transporter 1